MPHILHKYGAVVIIIPILPVESSARILSMAPDIFKFQVPAENGISSSMLQLASGNIHAPKMTPKARYTKLRSPHRQTQRLRRLCKTKMLLEIPKIFRDAPLARAREHLSKGSSLLLGGISRQRFKLTYIQKRSQSKHVIAKGGVLHAPS